MFRDTAIGIEIILNPLKKKKCKAASQLFWQKEDHGWV